MVRHSNIGFQTPLYFWTIQFRTVATMTAVARLFTSEMTMIHYIVWFNLREGVRETEGLDIVRAFLGELSEAGSIAGFHLLRNAGRGAKTRMPDFQALIEFRNEAQFQAAFRDQAARGIHAGMHGRMIPLVADFWAELFEQVAASAESAEAEPSLKYACEI